MRAICKLEHRPLRATTHACVSCPPSHVYRTVTSQLSTCIWFVSMLYIVPLQTFFWFTHLQKYRGRPYSVQLPMEVCAVHFLLNVYSAIVCCFLSLSSGLLPLVAEAYCLYVLSRASEVGSPTNPPRAPSSDKTWSQGSFGPSTGGPDLYKKF